MTTTGPVKSRTENARTQVVLCAPHGRRRSTYQPAVGITLRLNESARPPLLHRARFCLVPLAHRWWYDVGSMRHQDVCGSGGGDGDRIGTII